MAMLEIVFYQGVEKYQMTDLATHLLISNDLKTLLRFAIRDEFSKFTLSSTPCYRFPQHPKFMSQSNRVNSLAG
jgi:hypothetical protein